MALKIGNTTASLYLGSTPVAAYLGTEQVYSAAGGFPSSGLLAFWKLADTSDSSGNGKTLTNNDSVAFVAGKIGNAAEFDGTNYLSRSMAVNFSQDFTVSLWCKPEDVVGYGVMLMGSGAQTWNIAYTGNGTIDINNADVGFLNVAAAPEQWHHVVAARNSTTTKVWLNGVLADQDDNQITGSTESIVLGRDGGGSSSFYTGLLDAVGIWDRILSDAEIVALWNSGSGLEP
jgi:hypothetical protein